MCMCGCISVMNERTLGCGHWDAWIQCCCQPTLPQYLMLYIVWLRQKIVIADHHIALHDHIFLKSFRETLKVHLLKCICKSFWHMVLVMHHIDSIIFDLTCRNRRLSLLLIISFYLQQFIHIYIYITYIVFPSNTFCTTLASLLTTMPSFSGSSMLSVMKLFSKKKKTSKYFINYVKTSHVMQIALLIVF